MKIFFKYIIVLCLLMSYQFSNLDKQDTRNITGTYLWMYPAEFAGTLNEDNRIIIQKNNNNLEGLYHYVYPIKSTIDEDIYIVLKRSGNQFKGYYYGTTDEFVDVREGYYPGYFVLPMDSLRINEDSIYFVLMPQTKDFFTQPISKDIFSTKDALSKGYYHWDNYDYFNFAKLRKYKGLFVDSITLFFDKDPIYNISSKKFLKVKK